MPGRQEAAPWCTRSAAPDLACRPYLYGEKSRTTSPAWGGTPLNERIEGARMNCVVIIAGREAVPVRAIPFVTGWQSFSPDAVAEGLAHRLESGKLAGLTAYHIARDGSIAAMLPKEWDGPARALDALSAKLNEMEGDSYPAWREQSIPELPSHCFVWRDELEKNVTDWWRRLHLVGERPGDKELNFTPRIPPSLEEAVFEGMPKDDAAASVPAEAEAEPTADEAHPTVDDWREQARTITDELDSADLKVGAYDSVTNIADRVAKRMRELGINGPRGPLSGRTVLREALQGGKWKRKKLVR